MTLKKLTPYIVALVAFILTALAYFSPVLEGKKILQSDIVQFTGMSKEIQDYRAETGKEPYWTDAAFGGMPAYQVSTLFPNDYIKKLDDLIRFLPHPAGYLFLYFISFFVLMMVLKIDWRLAIFGALAFGFSTYYIVILGVGHNAKAHAIGYFPLVLTGVLLVFQKRYVAGFILTTLASALEITAGHVQMTYYLFFVLFFLGISELINAIRAKQLPDFLKSTVILLFAAVLAVGINANHLLPTREYAKESTRSKSELTINPDGSPKEITGGLDKSYITEYSYGIGETFNLFIPRFMGGGNAENIGTDSETYRLLKTKISSSDAKDFVKHAPMYWGTQPIVAAPAYIGAVLIFLFVIGIFLVDKKYKNWLLVSMVLALLLSWGKNLNFLTDLFIDYVPMYDKFRAVSSIQVIIEFTLPILAVLGLQQFLFNDKIDAAKKQKALLYSTYITGGIALFFLVLGRSWFSFESPMDADYDKMIPGFAEALVADRKAIFTGDSFRTLALVLLSAGALGFFLKNKIQKWAVIMFIGILILFDNVSVAKKYVNNDDFMRASLVKKPFEKTDVDEAILQDTTHYRVGNFTVNPLNDGSTSYYHKSVGGYHAAKPRRYQELFEYQAAQGNYAVLDMLNTKYFIVNGADGNRQVQLNDSVYGNAWFAHDLVWVKNADEEIKALDSVFKEKAVIDEQFKKLVPDVIQKADSTAQIELVAYTPNKLIYKSSAQFPQLALFSEMYYPHGWKATVDGKETPIFRANYVLRALIVPGGTHEIIFTFKPEVIKQSGKVSLISYVIFVILALILVFLKFSKKS